MLQNAKINVYYGTKDAYEFEKQNKRIDENALYFIEGVLYSGYELYSKDYKRVTELPDFGQSNIIYINTIDSSVVIWDGDKNEWIYICRPLSNEVVNDNTTIATSAVTYKVLEQSKEYVEQYTDAKCKEVFKDINLEIENSIMENNRNLFLGTSDKYNSIADICDALDSMSAVVIPKATASNDGLLSKEDYSKLSGISSGAEVNQNAFSNVVVGSTTITADAKTDTLTLVAGDNVTLTSNENGNEITISIAEYASLSETETDALI